MMKFATIAIPIDDNNATQNYLENWQLYIESKSDELETTDIKFQ